MMKIDAIIIGGGAAGLFCAIEAGRRGRRVLVIEHNSEPGRKIVISGGGRCNFTNRTVTADNFVSQNPHFCKSALARYTPDDFIALVRRHKIEFYEKKLGQLFCKNSSREIVGMLTDECRRAGVTLKTGCSVSKVTLQDDFLVATDQGVYRAPKLVVATGGLSFPKIGATGFGYEIARQFGHRIVQTRPSLVPLVFDNDRDFGQLAGIALDTVVTTGKRSFRENILLTHRGLSGPAILQISNYWSWNRPILIDLLPDHDARELVRSNLGSSKTVANFLSRHMPSRFADVLTSGALGSTPMNKLNRADTERLIELLSSWNLKFRDTEGWHKAEVTIGGVDTKEISSQTMESKKVDGLYFIGEVLDVTGWLGGYNFQWAWSSGFAAGNSL